MRYDCLESFMAFTISPGQCAMGGAHAIAWVAFHAGPYFLRPDRRP